MPLKKYRPDDARSESASGDVSDATNAGPSGSRSGSAQDPRELARIRANPTPRVLTSVGIDTSGSQVAAEREIRDAVRALPGAMSSHLAKLVAEVQLTQISTVPQQTDWQPAAETVFPRPWKFGGMSPVGTGARMTVAGHRQRLSAYGEAGVPVQASVLVFLTDGQVNSEDPEVTEQAVKEVNEFEGRSRTVHVFTATADPEASDLAFLKRLSPRYAPLVLRKGWQDLFVTVLPRLVTSASRSRPGQTLDLPRIDGVEQAK
jgi:hypothetical protein